MKKSFTLVELIIVITILAILSVSAFLIVSQWIWKSRDSRRLSDLNTIQNWLEVSLTQSTKYPVPDAAMNITVWGAVVWQQGQFWEWARSSTNIKVTPKDPLDWSNYIYYVTTWWKQFQIMWFLENNIISSVWLNDLLAADYSNRYPIVKWSSLGIVLDKNNNPIIWSSFDIIAGDKFKVFMNNSDVREKSDISWFSYFWTGRYPWCDTNNILIISWATVLHEISACNVWTSISWLWQASYGRYFKWGSNSWRNFIPSYIQNYVLFSWGTSWWIVNTVNLADTLQDAVNRELSKQWPCTNWYYVPTNDDWSQVMTILLSYTWGCSWCSESLVKVRDQLKLPLSWTRETNWDIWNAWIVWRYWASKISVTYPTRGHHLHISQSHVTPDHTYWRGAAFSVRCFKQ